MFPFALLGISFLGLVWNIILLCDRLSLWPAVRLMGYGSLALYALLMLKGNHYNTSSIHEN